MKVGTYIKQSAITTLANILTDNLTFARIKAAVKAKDDPNTPGNEKREAVLKLLKEMGVDLAKWLMNVLIELAVTYLRLQQQK